MGCIYSVGLDIKLREGRGGRKNLARVMHEWMCDRSKPIDGDWLSNIKWNFAECRKRGIRPDSVAGICKMLLAFHQDDCTYSNKDGVESFSSCFKASYGWGAVLEAAFRKMAWYLDEGSELEIIADEYNDTYKIETDYRGESVVWESHSKIH